MTCDDVRKYLPLYLDSELDAKASLEVRRHLDACESCRARFDSEERLERNVKEALMKPEPRDNVAWRKAVRPKRSLWKWAVAAGVIAVAVAVAIFLLLPRHRELDLARVACEHYDKFSTGQSPLDVTSTDEKTVREFFRTEFGELPDLPKLTLKGARRCNLGAVPTAFVVCEAAGKPVTVMVFAAKELENFPEANARAQGLDRFTCKVEGLEFQFARRGDKIVCALAPPGAVFIP